MQKSERDWVNELQSDDELTRDSASEELRRYLLRGLIGSFRQRHGVDEAFCEDIAQDATIKVIEKLEQFRGESRFTTWAMTIAIRLAVNEFRRKSFRNVSLESIGAADGAAPFEIPDSEPMPEKNAYRQQVLAMLRDLVEGLSSKQRMAVQALLNGMPVEVFAEKTDSNRNAVYKLVHDARVKLRQGFERAGFEWEDIFSALEGGR